MDKSSECENFIVLVLTGGGTCSSARKFKDLNGTFKNAFVFVMYISGYDPVAKQLERHNETDTYDKYACPLERRMTSPSQRS